MSTALCDMVLPRTSSSVAAVGALGDADCDRLSAQQLDAPSHWGHAT